MPCDFHDYTSCGGSLSLILRNIHKMALSFFMQMCYNSPKCGHYSLRVFLGIKKTVQALYDDLHDNYMKD